MIVVFATPEDVETAFYEAIARADLVALMSVWADDEEIVCIHPTGQRLTGAEAIRDSWRGIFANNPRLMVRLSRGVRWNGMLLSVHNVVETLYIGDERKPHGPMLATNVFQRGASGWRLLAHHSSTAADRDAADSSGVPASAREYAADAALTTYRAPGWLPGGHAQTIYPLLIRPDPLPYHRERWETPDGDFIDLDWNVATGVERRRHTAAAGSFSRSRRQFGSHYAITLMRAAAAIGWSGVVVNFRGCSGESNRLPRAYHSGDSDEIDWILRRLRALFPTAPALRRRRLAGWQCPAQMAGRKAGRRRRLPARPRRRSAPRST
jgi:ketosteroid isomerase-like protein